MTILINNAVLANAIFYAIFLLILFFSIRKRTDEEVLSVEASQELKGFAILTIVFAHVTYALVSDNRFLYPLSTMAGVGVNLFLMLSGYGLVISALKKPLSIGGFYKYRLSKLYLPFAIVLSLLFLVDYVFLGIHYKWPYILQSFLGFFNHANLYTDVNSPFWYLTLILFYYLVFPLLFIRRAPWLSAILIGTASYLVIFSEPSFLMNVIHLHRVHLLAFPLGMIMASFLGNPSTANQLSLFLKKIRYRRYPVAYILLSSIFLAIALYTFKNSGVGEEYYIEEAVSLISTFSILALFSLKRFKIASLYWVGVFSYEIYMLHWPVMYRYSSFFKVMSPWLAMILYLAVFILLGWLMQSLIRRLEKKPVS